HCARVCFVHSTVLYSLLLSLRPPPSPTLFPYTTLFRSTESGQELYRVATDVLEQLQRATDQLRAERPARQLSITTTTGFASLWRSEEHTSELQSHLNLVCRLLLEKKKNKDGRHMHQTSD